VQSPTSCFHHRQPASNPKTRFFSIDPQWQKPLTRQKNPLPKPSGTQVLNFPINRDQSRSMVERLPRNCFNQKQTAAFPKAMFSPLIAKFKTILHKRDRSTFRIEQSGQWRSMAEQLRKSCFG
jgi:hypothetical protein